MKLEEEKSERLKIFIIFVFICYSLIVARLVYLQVIRAEYYKNMSDNNRVKMKRIEGPRGKIFDRNGKPIATNSIGYRLVYLKGRTYDKNILEQISAVTGETVTYIERQIKKGEINRYTGENPIIDDLNEIVAHDILERIDEYPFLDVLSYPKRKYIYNELMSNVLGYVKEITKEELEKMKDKGYESKDIIGKRGLEKYYDQMLKGQNGYQYIEVDVRGRLVKTINEKEAVSGKDLYLTIDLDLQQYMTEKMKNMKGAFVALDAKTGGIVAIVSAPEFDLNKMSSRMSAKDWNEILNNKDKPMQNRVSSGLYSPGSTFKIVTTLAFLEYGINPSESVSDPGYFYLGKWRWNDWKLDGHGTVNMEKAMQDSCDTYFYTMGDRVGVDRISAAARKFGLGKATGLDIYEEKKGIVPDNEWKMKRWKQPWYRGDTINYSIGQGYLLTSPIQVAQMFAAVANDGKAYKPHVAGRIVDVTGHEEEIKPEIGIDLQAQQKHIDVIKRGLRKVVTQGTATNLKFKDIEIAGKTGSAENAHYHLTHGWFAGYAPASEPEIVACAFLEGAGHGGSVAAPLVGEFFKKYFEMKRDKTRDIMRKAKLGRGMLEVH